MTGGQIRVVCFDLGGVVVRICRTWEQACARAGIPVREPSRFAAADLATRRHALVDAYQTGRLECDAFWRDIAKATDDLYSPNEILRIHDAWIMEEYHGIDALVEAINDRPGITTACLSNTNARHWSSIRGEREPSHAGSRAVARLHRTLVSHELGLAKPNPAIYAAAERILEARPEHILFFDDLPENTQAAAERGWNAVTVDHEGDTVAQMREHLRAAGLLD